MVSTSPTTRAASPSAAEVGADTSDRPLRVVVGAVGERSAVLAVRGVADRIGIWALRDAVSVSIRVGVQLLELDLTHLRALDGSGARILEEAASSLRARGGHLVLRGMSDDVRAVLEEAGIACGDDPPAPPVPSLPDESLSDG
jgi:anti-anti-sigma regulatory factor